MTIFVPEVLLEVALVIGVSKMLKRSLMFELWAKGPNLPTSFAGLDHKVKQLFAILT